MEKTKIELKKIMVEAFECGACGLQNISEAYVRDHIESENGGGFGRGHGGEVQ